MQITFSFYSSTEIFYRIDYYDNLFNYKKIEN